MKTIKYLSGLVTLLIVLTSFNANAQKEKLQTAFIFQLTRMIEWCPDGKEGNFVIAIVGDAPALMQELSALNGRRIGSQAIEVKTFQNADAIDKSNILFVPNSEYGNIKNISTKADGTCTLIIAEKEGAANANAGISIVYNPTEAKLEMEINKGYMRKHSLNVNNQLYSLATKTY